MSDTESPWFAGSVTEAVNMATTKNVVFMVYIHDEGEESQQMNNITESSNSAKAIKDKTVALRISHDSEEAIMFGQLFTITKIPSIYLIRAGAVRDYVPGVVSEENLISRINTTASLNPSILPPPSSLSPLPPPPQQLSSSSSSTSTTTTTSLTTPSDSSSQPAVTQTPENSNDDLISRTERIKSKIEEKRKKREQEEIKTDKEREINRRNQGKEMQDIYRKRNEAKNKKIADDIAKQKKDDEEAKRRIREQIALDKAERQAKRQAELSLRQQLQENKDRFDNINHVEIINGSYAHSNISVRLLNGDTVRKKFQSTQTLEDVKAWIEEDRTDGNAPYNLIQNFPHRQYGINDETKSLKELNLCPSGTLICKPSKNVSTAYSNHGGFVWNFITLGLSMIGTMLNYINPLAYFYGNRQQRQSRNYNNARRHESNNNSSQSNDHEKSNNDNSGKSSERSKFGNNVRTLSQNDDDVDKRWTYNGNSTNQE